MKQHVSFCSSGKPREEAILCSCKRPGEEAILCGSRRTREEAILWLPHTRDREERHSTLALVYVLGA